MSKGDLFCCYCGRIIKYPLISTLEHLVPISKGGNNLDWNKKRCCNLCNGWRGNKSLISFKYEVEFFIKSNILKNGYSRIDFNYMIENIDHISNYIKKEGRKLLKGYINPPSKKKINNLLVELDRGNLIDN